MKQQSRFWHIQLGLITHNILFSEFAHHDDDINILLDYHSPEVAYGAFVFILGPLSSDVAPVRMNVLAKVEKEWKK